MDANSWIVDVKEKLEHLDTTKEAEFWKKQSIYRVPIYITDTNKKAYRPQVVSFGPYHHGDEQLKPMEKHKQRALLHLLKRTKKKVEDYVRALKEIEQELRDCYQNLEQKWIDGGEFLRVMILDACFMLEILRIANDVSNTYADSDPIFSSHGKVNTLPYIRRDMLMLENQIPLMLLEKFIEVGGEKTKNENSINKLILEFISPNTPPLPTGMPKGLHVLDVYRQSLLRGPSNRLRSTVEQKSAGIIRSATELHEAGIRFKKSKTVSYEDITFQHGVLRLPVVIIDDTSESTLLNLMAFERLHVGAGNEVTAYVFFMDNLIDSPRDVSLLHSKGIIQNAIGSDKAVAKLFNELSKDVTLDPDSNLDEVQWEVNEYCRKKWNEWRANLIHTYFTSPWALLSLIAAIFLIFLTVTQTFYAIYPYLPKKESTPSPSPLISPSPH